MKPENRRMISTKKAQALLYQECKYCSGLKGDVRSSKRTPDKKSCANIQK